ncbi:hypothetical protein K501DRAFT_336401 [Backusella circina FSU 941]|nr:hypothetical protein K501DRAFT_336401 [Backusella circina FSU 941]
MNFEDIVDMDWFNGNTTFDNKDTAFSSDVDHNQQEVYPMSYTDEMVDTTEPIPEIPIQPLAMPSVDQIKQLIEIAKQQLALREQQQQQQQQQQEAQPQPQHSLLQTSEDSDVFSTSVNMNNAPTNSIAPFTPVAYTTPVVETVSPESLTKPVASAAIDKKSPQKNLLPPLTEEPISLEEYAEADGIDLKHLTPRERRQLRNKISARNFRMRRKEYISTLEEQVNDHKQAAEVLQAKLQKLEDENKEMIKEMDILKRQNQLLQQNVSSTTSSPRITSSLPKPNLNKDISIMGTKATDSYRQDHCILVLGL